MNYKHPRHITLNLYHISVVTHFLASDWADVLILADPTGSHRPHPSRPHSAPSAVHSWVWNQWCGQWRVDKGTPTEGVEIWSLWRCKSQILKQQWLLLAGGKSSLWHLITKTAVSFLHYYVIFKIFYHNSQHFSFVRSEVPTAVLLKIQFCGM